jgi:hypothetical protein
MVYQIKHEVTKSLVSFRNSLQLSKNFWRSINGYTSISNGSFNCSATVHHSNSEFSCHLNCFLPKSQPSNLHKFHHSVATSRKFSPNIKSSTPIPPKFPSHPSNSSPQNNHIQTFLHRKRKTFLFRFISPKKPLISKILMILRVENSLEKNSSLQFLLNFPPSFRVFKERLGWKRANERKGMWKNRHLRGEARQESLNSCEWGSGNCLCVKNFLLKKLSRWKILREFFKNFPRIR